MLPLQFIEMLPKVWLLTRRSQDYAGRLDISGDFGRWVSTVPLPIQVMAN
jgi:hypothetical protein